MTLDSEQPVEAEAAAAPKTERYAWYVLGVLTLVYVFNFVDFVHAQSAIGCHPHTIYANRRNDGGGSSAARWQWHCGRRR